MNSPEIRMTEDGSNTIFNPDTGEHYHSIHGAIQESKHVFIEAGFNHLNADDSIIKILEVGFGTGLNCLLSLSAMVPLNRGIEYSAIEPFPLSRATVHELNYCRFDGLAEFAEEFQKMHRFVEGTVQLNSGFQLTKVNHRLQDIILNPDFYHLVYFDAFSADAQPELWQPEIFIKIRASMVSGGILVTYAAKGSVRRALQQAGFSTERLPGPPGKREMLRATAI